MARGVYSQVPWHTVSSDPQIIIFHKFSFLMCCSFFENSSYNRNRSIEEFENLAIKLCERYVGAETQSTCNIWFSKQMPGSARKRNSLAKREIGQSPGKRLTHLAKRRKTFSSANLQGMSLSDRRQLVVQIKYAAKTIFRIICKSKM